MDGSSSAISRITLAISGRVKSAFLRQMCSASVRLNAIASYHDQSDELFKVCCKEYYIIASLKLCTSGIPQQGNDVLVWVVERC